MTSKLKLRKTSDINSDLLIIEGVVGPTSEPLFAVGIHEGSREIALYMGSRANGTQLAFSDFVAFLGKAITDLEVWVKDVSQAGPPRTAGLPGSPISTFKLAGVDSQHRLVISESGQELVSIELTHGDPLVQILHRPDNQRIDAVRFLDFLKSSR